MFRIVLLSLIAILSYGCGNQVTFPVTVPIPETTVESSPVGPINDILKNFLPPISVDISEEREFERHDVDRIESIQLSELTLELTENSDAENFNFLQRVTIHATDQPGETTVQVAILDPVPDDAQRLHFDVTEEELNDIFGTDFTLRFEARGEPPSQEARFDGSAEFSVRARVL